MTVPKLKYLVSDPDRHGNARCYVRVAGKPKVRIFPRPGTAAFSTAYRSAITKLGLRPSLPHDRYFVYVATGPAADAVKIGITGHLKNRLCDLQVASPLRMEMPFTLETTRSKAKALEAALHARLAAWRIQGEWFELSVSQAKKAVQDMAAGRPVRIEI